MAARSGGGTWRSVVIGVTISAGVVGLAVAVSVGVFIYQHHHSEYVSPEAAAAELERDRRPFAGQRPLVDIRDGADPVLPRPSDSSTQVEKGPVAHTLHTVVFESRTGRLVRMARAHARRRLPAPGRRAIPRVGRIAVTLRRPSAAPLRSPPQPS